MKLIKQLSGNQFANKAWMMKMRSPWKVRQMISADTKPFKLGGRL